MRKLYEKNEVYFALVWIGLYVVVMNIAMQVCGGFDNLTDKTVMQMLVPVACILLLALLSTVWILHNGLAQKYGLCRLQGNLKTFLWFLPLIAMSCVNLKNGLGFAAPAAIVLLMMVNLAVAGYVEEIIFRGFLFRAMAKDSLKSAVIVSAVTFGAGHIVNLANTADTLGVFLQMGYAIAIGFLYTVIVYKGGSLWPCIASHMFVNGSSAFALEQGPFSTAVAALTGSAAPETVQICTSILIIILSSSYALWLWKKAEPMNEKNEKEVSG